MAVAVAVAAVVAVAVAAAAAARELVPPPRSANAIIHSNARAVFGLPVHRGVTSGMVRRKPGEERDINRREVVDRSQLWQLSPRSLPRAMSQ